MNLESQRPDVETTAQNVRLEYVQPVLEQHRVWVVTTGVSVPISP
jgi:hypothetical protein